MLQRSQKRMAKGRFWGCSRGIHWVTVFAAAIGGEAVDLYCLDEKTFWATWGRQSGRQGRLSGTAKANAI